MREEKDPIDIFLVSLLVSLLYIFGVIIKNQKDDLDSKNIEIRKSIERREGYIEHE